MTAVLRLVDAPTILILENFLCMVYNISCNFQGFGVLVKYYFAAISREISLGEYDIMDELSTLEFDIGLSRATA